MLGLNSNWYFQVRLEQNDKNERDDLSDNFFPYVIPCSFHISFPLKSLLSMDSSSSLALVQQSTRGHGFMLTEILVRW